jgi:chromosome segregation ATPase
MDWLKSKTTLVVAGFLALIGLQGYGMMSMRGAMNEQVSSVQQELQSVHNQDNAKLSQLSSDIEVITNRMGITAQELQQSQALAEQLKKDNAQTAQRLHRELAAKADTKAVMEFREEATNKLQETSNKLTEVQQDATTKIAGVSGDVQGVRTDLTATRTDLDATRMDLANSKKDINSLIARNSTELAELRRRGERNYVEFDLNKAREFQHIGDVMVQLKKTDVKKQKFDVAINADDSSIIKKDRTANEPIAFLVGRERLRYELVVNYVDKDRIRGYLSTPKDRVLSAEAPAARRLQQ